MYRLSLFQIIPPLQILNTRHVIWCSPQNIHLFILWWEKSTASPLLMAYTCFSRLLTLTCCYITWPCTPSKYYFSAVPHSIKVVISNWSRLERICCNQSSLDPNNPINRNAEHSSQDLKLSLWSTFRLTQTSPKATSTAVTIGRECPSISSLVCIPCQSFSIPANHRQSGLPQFAENSNYQHDKCWWSTILFIFFSWKGNSVWRHSVLLLPDPVSYTHLTLPTIVGV